jgi:uncharacterized membrane protein YhaH (DUF805 family)
VIEPRAAPRPRVDGLAAFFDSSGRVGRIGFLLKIGVLIAILAVYDAVARGEVAVLTGWLVDWPLFFSAACILSQRLHDHGRAGWWGAPILLAFCLAWPHPHGALGLIALAVTGGSGLWLGLMPGEPAFNRYGPSCVRQVQQNDHGIW